MPPSRRPGRRRRCCHHRQEDLRLARGPMPRRRDRLIHHTTGVEADARSFEKSRHVAEDHLQKERINDGDQGEPAEEHPNQQEQCRKRKCATTDEAGHKTTNASRPRPSSRQGKSPQKPYSIQAERPGQHGHKLRQEDQRTRQRPRQQQDETAILSLAAETIRCEAPGSISATGSSTQ